MPVLTFLINIFRKRLCVGEHYIFVVPVWITTWNKSFGVLMLLFRCFASARPSLTVTRVNYAGLLLSSSKAAP